MRVSEASSVFGENASSFAINRGKKNTRENAFSFFFASRRSQTENIENIMYRYAPFFISNLLNASDRDESPDENCRRRRSRAEKKKKKRRKERARARDRRTVSSSKRRRRGGGGRGSRETRSLPWLLVKRYPDIWGEVLKSLNTTDVKFLCDASRESRAVIQRQGYVVRDAKFNVAEFSSVSTLEFAWDHIPRQSDVVHRVAGSGRVSLLRWLMHKKNAIPCSTARRKTGKYTA